MKLYGLVVLDCLLRLISAQDPTITLTVTETSTICPCSSSRALSSLRSFTTSPASASTLSQTSSPVASQPTSSAVPSTSRFPIRIQTAEVLRLRKRAFYYIGFEDDTAITVSDLVNATLFRIVGGFLISDSDGKYVGVNTSNPFQPLQKYTDKLLMTGGWSLDTTGGPRSIMVGQQFYARWWGGLILRTAE